MWSEHASASEHIRYTTTPSVTVTLVVGQTPRRGRKGISCTLGVAECGERRDVQRKRGKSAFSPISGTWFAACLVSCAAAYILPLTLNSFTTSYKGQTQKHRGTAGTRSSLKPPIKDIRPRSPDAETPRQRKRAETNRSNLKIKRLIAINLTFCFFCVLYFLILYWVIFFFFRFHTLQPT